MGASAKTKKRRFSLLVFFFFGFSLSAQTPAQPGGTLNLDEALRLLDGAGAGNVELRWDPFFGSGTFVAGRHEAAFASGAAGERGTALLDRKEILTLPLPYLEKGGLAFPETFVVQVKNAFSRYAEEDRAGYRIAAIIIDPGHGGRDEGAIGTHRVNGKPFVSMEKDIVLKVGLQVYAAVRAAFPDKRVMLTRSEDTYPTLEERVLLANSTPLANNEAAIYISIHANASPSADAKGYEVWYLSPGYRREVIDPSKYADSKDVIPILNSMLEEELTTESILMARYILAQLDEKAGKTTPNRGLKEWDWYVVRNARMPSVLVELPFVSNRADALLMADEAYLKKLSEALYKGISDFVAFFERSGGFTALQ